MKKRDLLLIIVLLVIAGSTLLGYRYMNQGQVAGEGQVVITIDGNEYGTYPIGLDTVIEIPAKLGNSTLEIKDGKVKMLEASCPDQVCVKTGEIHYAGHSIVCLPNRIVVEIVNVGNSNNNIDATVQ